jgi:hypothetical protein
MTGWSAGSSLNYFYAESHPDWFAAINPLFSDNLSLQARLFIFSSTCMRYRICHRSRSSLSTQERFYPYLQIL